MHIVMCRLSGAIIVSGGAPIILGANWHGPFTLDAMPATLDFFPTLTVSSTGCLLPTVTVLPQEVLDATEQGGQVLVAIS
jgi:hypothetical protein